MLHPDVRQQSPRETDRIARVAAQNISHEIEPREALLAIGAVAVLVMALVAGGIAWLADARDDLRAVRVVVEKCK